MRSTAIWNLITVDLPFPHRGRRPWRSGKHIPATITSENTGASLRFWIKVPSCLGVRPTRIGRFGFSGFLRNSVGRILSGHYEVEIASKLYKILCARVFFIYPAQLIQIIAAAVS